MAQLTQDCFAFGKKLVKLETALNTIKKNILPATLPQLEKNCMVNLATGRLVSYSVTAEWNTHTLLNPQASLETSATMDVVCVALDASNVPLETINVLNVESSDHSFRCVRPSSESEVSLCCI